MKILMIGAHPDDCEIDCSGLAIKFLQNGHEVRFLSMCDGSGGHHVLNRNEIAARRWGETRKVAELLGIQYDVWNIPDCELVADLPTRARLISYIRKYSPDVVFCHRPNDYHADHRNAGLLLQDASYLLIVPNYCPDVPPMRFMPIIMHSADKFKNPVFEPDIVVSIDDVVQKKMELLNCHTSQMYEWLPYTYGTLDQVPEDPEERFRFLCGDTVDENTPDSLILSGTLKGRYPRFAYPAAKYRKELVERYGEAGNNVVFAEAYSVCEYGAPLTEEAKNMLFPF